jgi:phosphatidylinositol glycan class Q protein
VSPFFATLSCNDHLRTAIVWLESFPAGFKLNVPLTRNMGHQLLLLLDHWQSHVLQPVLGSVDRRSLIVNGLAMTSLVFGSTTLVALLVDAVQVLTLHLTLIHLFFARVHKFQLYMLSSLWKLFRGKKRNPLRQRTDTMEYDSMQLLVGMLAFTFVLFLFTTILVYHVFFGTITFLIQPIGLWLMYGFVNDFPFGQLWKRFLHPTKVGVGIYLKEQSPTTAWLCVIPRSYISVMATFFKRYVGRILRLSLSAVASLATGERIEMLRRCISDD